MRGLLWGIVVACAWPTLVFAQAPDPFAVPEEPAPPADPNPFVDVPEASGPVIDPSCMPGCRAGYTCVSGQCVSACNPPCAPGSICASDGGASDGAGGVCVPEAVLHAPPPTMCSPACPPGMVCTPAGTCAPSGAVQGYAPPAPIVPRFDRNLARKATSRGVLSLVSAGLAWGVGFAAASLRLQDESCIGCGDDAMPEIAIGTLGLVFTAVMGPIASGGGRAGRRAGGDGIGVLRAFGWISYVLTLVGGVVALAATAADADVPAAALFGIATLGGASFVLFGIDGIVAGSQARQRANEAQRSLTPQVSLWRESVTNAPRPAFGLRLSF